MEQRKVVEEDRLAAPVTDPAVLHSFLQMFRVQQVGGGQGGMKRGVQGDSEEMESPQSKRSRFL